MFSRTVTDSTNKYVVHIQAARKNLESDHGDPFTLLNAFDEWIQVQYTVLLLFVDCKKKIESSFILGL